MTAVLRHELRGYVHSLTGWLYCAFILAFVGVGALMYNIQSAVANFEYVLGYVCIGLVFIVPVLTMRSLAEERKQKTDQLLYSLPLTAWHIIGGKFLALLAVFTAPLVIVAFYPLLFSRYGEVYLPTSYGSLLAFWLLGAACIAIGMFVSSLTENQGFAAGIAIVALLLNYFSVSLAEYVSATAFGSFAVLMVLALLLGFVIRGLTHSEAVGYGIAIALMVLCAGVYFIDSTKFEGLVPDIMEKLSLFQRFTPFINGVFDVTGLVYFLTVIGFFLFLTVQSLEKRRYN